MAVMLSGKLVLQSWFCLIVLLNTLFLSGSLFVCFFYWLHIVLFPPLINEKCLSCLMLVHDVYTQISAYDWNDYC
jgi:hypothetical protein